MKVRRMRKKKEGNEKGASFLLSSPSLSKAC